MGHSIGDLGVIEGILGDEAIAHSRTIDLSCNGCSSLEFLCFLASTIIPHVRVRAVAGRQKDPDLVFRA